MSKNLKDLIDALEEKTQAQTEFEINVRELKEENERLKFTIKEQQLLIEEQKEKLSKDFIIPEDVRLLKEIAVSQRQELNKKDKDIEILENKLEELKKNLEISDNFEKNDELINFQKLIIQLTEENEVYRLNEASAKTLIEELTKKNEEYRVENENLKEQLENFDSDYLYKYSLPSPNIDTDSAQEINALKEKIILLEEEKEISNRELETAKITQDNLIHEININLNEIYNLEKEISDKNVKLNVLNENIENLSQQNNELKEELSKTQTLIESHQREVDIGDLYNKSSVESLNSLEKENIELKKSIDELNKNKINIERLKEDNINLNNVISELIQNQTQLMNYNLDEDYCLPKSYQSTLFMRLFTILENHKKDMIIQSLIQDLINTKNNDIKRSIINLLSGLKDIRVFDALKKVIHDDDWLIRLYIIRSLYKFETNDIKTHFTESLKQLRNDKDSDVREASRKLLNRIIS